MSGRAPVPAADKLFFEREMLSLGAENVAGADEAGRGPLAGPVVCAAVILPLDRGALIDGIDDSKKLKAEERERLAALIRERALSYGRTARRTTRPLTASISSRRPNCA